MDLKEESRNNRSDPANRLLQVSNELMAKIGELANSLESTQGQDNNIQKALDANHRDYRKVIAENKKLKFKADGDSRRNYLRINGIPESNNDSWEK